MGGSADVDPVPRITLITRAGCHLCEGAREVVRDVAGSSGAGWHEVDVDSDPELAARHGDEVPVVLVDGRVHTWWRVDKHMLEQSLLPGGGGARRWSLRRR